MNIASYNEGDVTIEVFDGLIDYGIRVRMNGAVVYEDSEAMDCTEYGFDYSDCDDGEGVEWSAARWREVLAEEFDAWASIARMSEGVAA